MELQSEYIEEFKYLDELKEAGTTNMFAAAGYLTQLFGHDRYEAKKILVKWMNHNTTTGVEK